MCERGKTVTGSRLTCISSPSSSSCVLLCLEESWSWSHRSLLQVFRCRKSWPVPLQISLIGRPSNLQPFCTQVHQKHCTLVPLLCVCTSSLFNVKTVLIVGVCGAFTATPPSAAGACPGMNGSSSSRQSLNVSLRKRFHCDSCIQ